MKNFILSLAILIVSLNCLGQFPGRKTQKPFSAVDEHIYKVGDEISLGYATRGNMFENVYIYDFKSGFEQFSEVLDILNGQSNGSQQSSIVEAPKEFNLFKGKILYFKEVTTDNSGKKVKITVAIMSADSKRQLAVNINDALIKREMISLNTDFIKRQNKDASDFTSDEMHIKSFNSNFNVKVISVEGNKDEQTVKVTFLITHNLPHQMLSFYMEESKAYDFSGNIYNPLSIEIGDKSENSYRVYNKIPTNVPVKAAITIKKVLPEIQSFSFLTINVYFIPYADFTPYSSFGEKTETIEVNNLKIEWK